MLCWKCHSPSSSLCHLQSSYSPGLWMLSVLVTVPTVMQNSLHPLSTSSTTVRHLTMQGKNNRRTDTRSWLSAPHFHPLTFYAECSFCCFAIGKGSRGGFKEWPLVYWPTRPLLYGTVLGGSWWKSRKKFALQLPKWDFYSFKLSTDSMADGAF